MPSRPNSADFFYGSPTYCLGGLSLRFLGSVNEIFLRAVLTNSGNLNIFKNGSRKREKDSAYKIINVTDLS